MLEKIRSSLGLTATATPESQDSTSNIEMKTVLDALSRSQAMIQFETDGTILFANENFLSTLGYRAEEVIGKHHSIFVEPGYGESVEYREFWDKLRQGEFQSSVFKRVAKDGSDVWIQASYNPIMDSEGRVTKVIKYASDITQATLESAADRGQVAAIHASQAVIFFELDGTIIEANDNFLGALGYSIDEIRGRHHSMFVNRETRESNEYQEFWRALREGQFQAGEYLRIRKDGRDIWIQASYNPILDPNGTVVKVVKFATDITAQVEARQEADRVGTLVDENLDRILNAIEDVTEQTGTAASASDRTLETVQTIAAATAQFEISADEISRNMEQSKTEVDRAISEAADAGESTRDLTNAAQAMNSVVDVIQDIAGQIKLLSLNATIEAASAGESGRGFAVVASEVKSLANQVANATDQISTEIESMQGVCSDVVQRIERIQSAVEVVNSSVSTVVGSVTEQATSTRDISERIQSTSGEVDAIHKNLESISGAAHTAKDLADEGNSLFQSLRETA